jgi:hypothetical protein
MSLRRPALLGIVLGWLLAAPAPGRADQIRFRYVPADAAGTLTQVAAGPDGALGERIVGLSRRSEPYPHAVRPTQITTFRHPYTGANVAVPLRLPASLPRMEHRPDRIIYNYGTYTVEARFLTDGSVEVVYNSGLFRPVPFE